ncbi:MAG TPA: hypothetical protein VGN11_10020 [Candidatus Baltobacteraceae bacterium]|jgi:hypothetical protein|nr:hypothetical protein [Candidatus Baltobacteraceae bacterium]
MSDEPTPDFAMLRAVEILAGIYERTAPREDDVPAPASDKPIVLFNETIALDVNATVRADVERHLGTAFSYPARGWHTYCVRGGDGKRQFLSLFYSAGKLASAELYYPKVDRAPKLEPVDLRFRFSPGEVALGEGFAKLSHYFRRLSALAESLGAYAEMFEANFPGGAAYAMGNAGSIERLAIYVLRNDGTSGST